MRVVGCLLVLLQVLAMVCWCWYPGRWQWHYQRARALAERNPPDLAGSRAALEDALRDTEHFTPDGRRALTLENLAILDMRAGALKAGALDASALEAGKERARQALAIYQQTDGPQSRAVARVNALLATGLAQ
jgi:hypothetical protein